MTSRPRTGLGRVLDDLGGTFLELAYGNIDRVRELGGIAFHDPIDVPVLPPSALVLGVGVSGDDEVVRVLKELGGQAAAALVVRSPVPAGRSVIAAVAETGVALLGLARGASWSQLAAMLSSLLADSDVGVAEAESLGGMPSGDLFALANAIAATLDAPITIEDRSSRVLAFSGRQDEADQSRVDTILGLRFPNGMRGRSPSAASFASSTAATVRSWSTRPIPGSSSPCPGSPSRYEPATRCSGRSGLPPARPSTAGAPRRCARRPHWWPCTCCGCAPAPTSSDGCAPSW